jgi:uncharacterized membrane protein
MCILYNQRDATYTMFFIIISALHVSGGFFRPPSGTYKTVCAALGIVMLSCCIPLVWMGWNCRAFSAHHQQLIKLYVHSWDGTVQLQTEQFQPIHNSGRQQESVTIPTAANTVL